MEYVYTFPLPGWCREAVTPNDDGSYTILINQDLSVEQQLKAYRHAMWHVTNKDFEREDVQEIEWRAHKEE